MKSINEFFSIWMDHTTINDRQSSRQVIIFNSIIICIQTVFCARECQNQNESLFNTLALSIVYFCVFVNHFDMLIFSSELLWKFSHLYAINVITSCAVNWYRNYANRWTTKFGYKSTLIDFFYNLSAGEWVSIYLFVYSFNVNFCFVF